MSRSDLFMWLFICFVVLALVIAGAIVLVEYGF